MLLLLLIVIFLLTSYPCLALKNGKPNVLLIMVDDLRPALGTYGDPLALTPYMDRLAAASYKMTEAHCQLALCGPSRTSLLTSRLPQTMGTLANRNLNWRRHWSTKDVVSLPQFYKLHGYATKSIGKIFHPIGRHGHNPDDFPYSWTQPPFFVDPSEIVNISCPMYDGTRRRNLLCAVDVENFGRPLPDMKIKDEALNFLSHLSTLNESKTSPFFLGVGFHKPHVPFHLPRQFLDLHDLKKFNEVPLNRTLHLPDIAWNPWMDLKKRDDIKALNINFPFGQMPSRFNGYIRHHYYAAVTYVDHLVGELLQGLVKYGFGDNTIVTLVSDHGWMLGENQEWSKYSNYKVATRVPWLLHIPEDCPGRLSQLFAGKNDEDDEVIQDDEDYCSSVVDRPVQLLDLFPTLVHRTRGLPRVPKCNRGTAVMRRPEKVCTEGRSLFEDEASESFAFWQYPRPSLYPAADSDQPLKAEYMGYSIFDSRFRMTKWVKFNQTSMTADFENVVAVELYDHLMDPLETRNVAETHRDVVSKLSPTLFAHFN